MPGETDLTKILATLKIRRREEPFTVVTVPKPVELGAGVEAVINEGDSVTAVVTLDAARRRGWHGEFEAAWLTVDAHTALDGVGLTAALSRALAAEGIPCNILAGYFHDHLLVALDRADDAVAAIDALTESC